MTLIVEALNRIARECSVRPPTSWVTATRDDQVELRDDFMLQTVEDIQDRLNLPEPMGAKVKLSALSSTIDADGSRVFALPSTFKRLHRSELAVYDAEQDRPAVPVPDDGVYAFLTDTGTAGIVHYYQIKGYQGNFKLTMYRDPGATPDISVFFNTYYWKASAGGTLGATFTDETDVLIMPRRLLEAGTVWRFRERRGLSYDDKYAEYERLIQRFANDIRGRRKLSFAPPAKDVRWQDLVPSFIPSS